MNNQSFITKWILKLGLVKSEQQVPVVLIAIIALAAVLIFLAWPSSGNGDRPNPTLSVTSHYNA